MLDRVLSGEDPTAVWNERSNLLYQVKTVGEVSRDGWAVQQLGGYPAAGVRNVQPGATLNPMSEAFELAKAGGRHSGTYQRYKDSRTPEIEKSVRSLQKRISEHRDKIANPMKYVDEGIAGVHLDDLVARYWPNEIADMGAKIEILRGILKEKKNG